MTKIFVLFFLLSAFGHAKPKEELVAADVCRSINSNKYQAQCESEIRGGQFSSLGINTCVKLFKSDDSSLKSCMGVIKDKTYTQSQIDKCLLQKKYKINKCLSVSGTLFKAEPPSDNEAIPVGH